MDKLGSELDVGDVFTYPNQSRNWAVVEVSATRPFLGAVRGRSLYAVGYKGKGEIHILTIIDNEQYRVHCPHCSSPHYNFEYRQAHSCPTCGLGIRWIGPFIPASARYGYKGYAS